MATDKVEIYIRIGDSIVPASSFRFRYSIFTDLQKNPDLILINFVWTLGEEKVSARIYELIRLDLILMFFWRWVGVKRAKRKFWLIQGGFFNCPPTMWNDVEIRKSSRVTMQAFCECGFVQTYCNNRSLHLNIYTFKHGLKTFFIQILWYLFA